MEILTLKFLCDVFLTDAFKLSLSLMLEIPMAIDLVAMQCCLIRHSTNNSKGIT